MMQFKCRIFAVLLLALLASASCTEMEQPVREETPIAFSAVVSGDMPATKAEGMIDESRLKAAGFGVFGCYTGLHNYSESDANASFMYNQKLEWKEGDGRWEYEPVKYWPNGEGEATTATGENPHYVSFFAYAPYSNGSNPCIPSCILEQEKGDPWILYRLSENPTDQVDLLYAQPLIDQTKPKTGSKLEFTFKHALACVGDTVNISGPTSPDFDIRLKEVKIDYTLTSKARLVLWNRGKANWSAVQSEDVVTTRSFTLLSAGNASLPATFQGKGVFCIPAEVPGYPQKATIHVTYVVNYTNASLPSVERSSSSELLLKGLLQEGKKLDININMKYQ